MSIQERDALDLGMILGEGYLAERQDIIQRLLALDLHLPLTHTVDLFAIFDYYSNPEVCIPNSDASQTITGIELPSCDRRLAQADT